MLEATHWDSFNLIHNIHVHVLVLEATPPLEMRNTMLTYGALFNWLHPLISLFIGVHRKELGPCRQSNLCYGTRTVCTHTTADQWEHLQSATYTNYSHSRTTFDPKCWTIGKVSPSTCGNSECVHQFSSYIYIPWLQASLLLFTDRRILSLTHAKCLAFCYMYLATPPMITITRIIIRETVLTYAVENFGSGWCMADLWGERGEARKHV